MLGGKCRGNWGKTVKVVLFHFPSLWWRYKSRQRDCKWSGWSGFHVPTTTKAHSWKKYQTFERSLERKISDAFGLDVMCNTWEKRQGRVWQNYFYSLIVGLINSASSSSAIETGFNPLTRRCSLSDLEAMKYFIDGLFYIGSCRDNWKETWLIRYLRLKN